MAVGEGRLEAIVKVTILFLLWSGKNQGILKFFCVVFVIVLKNEEYK